MECYYFGTFNPVHKGHIKTAFAVKKLFGFDKIIFVPVYSPCHKKDCSNSIDRLNMLKLIENDDIKVSDIEFKLPKPSYSYRTIEELLKNKKENEKINFIIGFDAFIDIENWKNTLKQAKSLELEHISLYGLKIEEGTPFYSNPPKNLPDEDTQALMYEIAMEELSDFYHYEFSNFAKDKNHPSRHNLTYWNLAPYWGFGLGASGFVNLRRYINETNLKNYLDNPIKEKNYEPKDMQKLLEEYIFLGFRKQEGIILKEINEKFQIDFEKKYQKILEKYLKTNHLKKTKEGYKLTKQGVLVSNYILCDFID